MHAGRSQAAGLAASQPFRCNRMRAWASTENGKTAGRSMRRRMVVPLGLTAGHKPHCTTHESSMSMLRLEPTSLPCIHPTARRVGTPTR